MEDGAVMRRLHWRCRRGLLELDIVLQRFVRQRYPQLTAEGKAAFLSLLELQDATLLAYLHGSEAPEDPALRAVLRELR